MGESEIHLGDGNHLTMKTSTTVSIQETLKLYKTGRLPIELKVKIIADFEKIPSEYHNTFLQMLSAKYGGTVNCYSNTEPFTVKEPKKKKWFQIWK